MAGDDFGIMIRSYGAVESNVLNTSNKVYQYGKSLFHFIPLSSYPSLENKPQYLLLMSREAEKNGLKLIHIWEDCWIHKQQIIKGRISALMGKSQRIHGRKTMVKRMDKHTAHAFLETHHLQGATSAYYKFGLYADDEPVAVATFSKSRIMHDGPNYYRSYELERFASKSGYTVTGALSKLLSFFVELHNPAHLMTYADREWGTGEGYTKLGFKHIGELAPQLFWVHKQNAMRIKPISETENMEHDYALYNAGSIKFVLDRRNV
jgi:hypothetical protein